MRNLILTGTVGTDAQQKLTKGGSEYIAFRFVNNEPTDPKNADGKSAGFWVNVISFNPYHKNLSQYLTKGKQLIIVGSYDDNVYTSQFSGNCEIGRTLRAIDIQFLNTGQPKQEETHETKSKPTATTTTTEMPKVTGATPSTSATAAETETTAAYDDDEDLPF